MAMKLLLKGVEETPEGTKVAEFLVDNMIIKEGFLCLISENGTIFKLTVGNDGILSTTEIT